MFTQLSVFDHLPGRRWAWLFFLSLFILQATPFPAAAADPALQTAMHSVPASDPLLAEGWSFQKFFGPVETALSDRRRMIQMAVIGMCIGLYILMRK